MIQPLKEPSRKAKIPLDLILTNRPDQVLRVDVLPAISDHDIVFTEMDFRPGKKPRLIPLNKKQMGEDKTFCR